MKIAVLAPSPVPFKIGGLEKLAWELVTSINQTTEHQAELIKMPLYENSFLEIISSYLKASRVKLDHFDLIISTKYPSWMVRHHYHIVYMTHTLRGVYDTYTGRTGWWGYLREHPLRMAGIYMRAFVHFCDRIGLSPKRIKGYYAISRTVSSRTDYFPAEAKVGILYPPSPLMSCLREKQDAQHDKNSATLVDPGSDYFFTVSRLDGPKRIELIIQAMKLIEHPCRLLIAGEGPRLRYLQQLAGSDERIVFLGNVLDADLIEYYRNSVAVVFTPHHEDYGLVTIEAMHLKVPVITTHDSGGPSEIIHDGHNGYIVDPSAESIAERMKYILENRTVATSVANEGYQTVRNITWSNLVTDLLKNHDYINNDFEKENGRRKMTVLSTYPIFPSRGGGQERIYNVYRLLSLYYDVTILSFSSGDKPFRKNQITPHCVEISVPQSERHSEAQWRIQEEIKHTVTDILMPYLAHLTPKFLAILEYYLQHSDILIASHPFLFPLIERRRPDQIFIYESHNVEYLLKKSFLPETRKGNWLLSQVKKVEEQACRDSRIVFTTSPEEQEKLNGLYGLDLQKAHISTNGVDTSLLQPPSDEERREAKDLLGFPDRTIVLFMGSWHPPNLDAFKFIIEHLAPHLPTLVFVVMGSVREEYYALYGKTVFPDNVIAVGAVNEKTKQTILQSTDIAINPVDHGSGTNLKMLDYMAVGIPVISTPVGARGFTREEESSFLLRDRQQFVAALDELANDPTKRQELGFQARNLVTRRFDWQVIVHNMHDIIEHAFPNSLQSRIDMDKETQLGSGWYPAERWRTQKLIGSTQKTVRWTTAEAAFLLPNIARNVVLTLTCEPSVREVPLQVLLDNENRLLFDDKIQPHGQKVVIPLSLQSRDRELKFIIRCDTWIPAQYYNNDDQRRLGIAVSGITLEERAESS